MNKYEALETMLEKTLEHGTNIETVLAEFPEFAEELRPLLQSAIDASALAVPPASADVARRGRTRLLQHAAQMRDAAPVPRASFFDFRLATATLTLLLVFFVGGTGIVSASSSALPGDSLYTVKRGWESTHLWFADDDRTASLEAEYEEERREEVQELLGGGRLAAVRFEGVVMQLNGSQWNVAGVPVIISGQTDIESLIDIGSDVIVSGQTQPDGTVLAEKIILSRHPEGNEARSIEDSEEDIDEPDEIEIPETEEDVIETSEPEDDEDVDSEDDIEVDDDSDNAETSESDDEETSNSAETPEPENDEPDDDETDDDSETDDDEPDDDESDDN